MSKQYAEMLDQMRTDTLHTCDFGHGQHIAVAYQALEEEPFFEALALFARGIQGAAARSGAADKFNATVTMAYMSIIAERRATGDFADADDFLARNPDLRAKGLLARWFSAGRMNGPLARGVALMPDRVMAPA